MKLKLDENLGRGPAELFRGAGHDVQTVSEEGLAGANDKKVIHAARQEKRCLVTMDLHFSNPLVFKPWLFGGIAVFRISSRPSARELLAACETLCAALKGSEISGKLWIVRVDGVKEYTPDR